MSFEISGVTSSFMVMTLGKDRVVEGVSRGNIDMALVCEDVVIKCPVREA